MFRFTLGVLALVDTFSHASCKNRRTLSCRVFGALSISPRSNPPLSTHGSHRQPRHMISPFDSAIAILFAERLTLIPSSIYVTGTRVSRVRLEFCEPPQAPSAHPLFPRQIRDQAPIAKSFRASPSFPGPIPRISRPASRSLPLEFFSKSILRPAFPIG